MFGTIRKHQTWLWSIIIFFTCVGMVIYFGPASKVNGNGRSQDGNVAVMDGKPVSPTEYQNAYREVTLQYFLNNGLEWPKTGFNADQETYKWIFITRSLDKYNIDVDDASVARVVNNILGGIGYQMRQNRPLTYAEFIDGVLRGNGSVDDFQGYIGHSL